MSNKHPSRLLRFAAGRSDDVKLTTESNVHRAGDKPNKPVYNWHTTNARLEHGKAFTTLQESFSRVVPKGYSLRSYLERVIHERPGKALGLEVGGIGSALFKDFSLGAFEASLAVSLTDYRSQKQKENDATRRHECLAADLSEPETYSKIEKWLGGRKFDFIIERILSGFDFLPKDPLFLMTACDALYGMLKENGVMFIQIPDPLTPYVLAWKKQVLHQYSDVLEIEVVLGPSNGTAGSESVMRLVKKPGAPTHLPMLRARKQNV